MTHEWVACRLDHGCFCYLFRSLNSPFEYEDVKGRGARRGPFQKPYFTRLQLQIRDRAVCCERQGYLSFKEDDANVMQSVQAVGQPCPTLSGTFSTRPEGPGLGVQGRVRGKSNGCFPLKIMRGYYLRAPSDLNNSSNLREVFTVDSFIIFQQ
ncbi:hypothetical protein GJAV_G00243740 [Gymnothorax javanicus]|nr:hypothetical protein GJAV_G00243740 [Gymnothorax javanicus]